MEHSQLTIGVAMHAHLGLDVMAAMSIRRYLQDQPLRKRTQLSALTVRLSLLTQDVAETAADPGHEAEPSSCAGQANSALNAG